MNSICEQTDAANGVLAALCLRRRSEREQPNDAHHLDFGADRRPSVPQASPSGRDRPRHQEGSGGMTLILLQVIIQSIASTLLSPGTASRWVFHVIDRPSAKGDAKEVLKRRFRPHRLGESSHF